MFTGLCSKYKSPPPFTLGIPPTLEIIITKVSYHSVWNFRRLLMALSASSSPMLHNSPRAKNIAACRTQLFTLVSSSAHYSDYYCMPVQTKTKDLYRRSTSIIEGKNQAPFGAAQKTQTGEMSTKFLLFPGRRFFCKECLDPRSTSGASFSCNIFPI